MTLFAARRSMAIGFPGLSIQGPAVSRPSMVMMRDGHCAAGVGH